MAKNRPSASYSGVQIGQADTPETTPVEMNKAKPHPHAGPTQWPARESFWASPPLSVICAGSALFGRHREECSCFLFHILAAAVRAFSTFLFVLGQGEDFLERLITVMANVVINRHGDLHEPNQTKM
jgi:hypothetical protein